MVFNVNTVLNDLENLNWKLQKFLSVVISCSDVHKIETIFSFKLFFNKYMYSTI